MGMTTEQDVDAPVTAVEVRAEAVRTAAAALGRPELYHERHTSRDEPEPARGMAGAFGATRSPRSHETRSSGYPAALVRVADFIATGAVDRDDLLPQAAAVAREGAAAGEVRESVELMREARG